MESVTLLGRQPVQLWHKRQAEMTVNYQENPLKDWFHRQCALTSHCLFLGQCALFSRAIAMVPRHGQEVCWVPKYGLNSTETKRGGGGSIRTMTQKGKVLPEPLQQTPAAREEAPAVKTGPSPVFTAQHWATRLASRSGLVRFATGILFLENLLLPATSTSMTSVVVISDGLGSTC